MKLPRRVCLLLFLCLPLASLGCLAVPSSQGFPCQGNDDCWGKALCLGGICQTSGTNTEAGGQEPGAAEPSTDGAVQETPVELVPEVGPEVRQEGESVGPEAGPEAGPEQAGDASAACVSGETRSCYTGPSETEGKGICRAGLEVCQGGLWGACQLEVLPEAQETCGDSIDNNCDGNVNEGCTCTSGQKQPCGSDTGICEKGEQTCQGDKWGPCEGGVSPQVKEECDNQDNNCDGKTDEGLSRACYTGATGTAGKGACKGGLQTCTEGKWGACTGQITPKTETCNDVDDDCDGAIDEGLTRPCYAAGPGCSRLANGTYECEGACRPGAQQCSEGKWGACKGAVRPAAKEQCDKQDDDCDGDIDEGCTCTAGQQQPCGASSRPPCKLGSQTCDAAGKWGACTGEVKPKAETCNDVDDDCDGAVDEGLTRPCYTVGGSSCVKQTDGSYQCKGVCQAGIQQCSEGQWGTCLQQIRPGLETCNGKDDDCDGSIDESLSRACYNGAQGCTKTNGVYTCVGTCKTGTQACSSGQWGACNGQTLPRTEQCDGVDDSCDGTVDETCSCVPTRKSSVTIAQILSKSTNLTLNADGSVVAAVVKVQASAGAFSHQVKRWDSSTGLAHNIIFEPYPGLSSGVILRAWFSPSDPTLLATTSGYLYQPLRLFAVESRSSVRKLKDIPTTLGGASGKLSFKELAFSFDGKYLAVSTSIRTILVWDVSNRTSPQLLKTLAAQPGEIESLAVHENGQVAYIFSDKVAVWNFKTGTQPLWSMAESNIQRALAISRDGKKVLLSKYSTSYELVSRDLLTGQNRVSFGLSKLISPNHFAFSPLGGFFIATASNATQAWEPKATNTPKHNYNLTNFYWSDFSGQGKKVALGGASGIYIYECP